MLFNSLDVPFKKRDVDKSKIDIDLYRYCLEESKKDWNNASQKFRDIDQKAQATATLAGVFIAAVFAVLQNTTVRSNSITLNMLIASIILFASSILSSLFAMKVRAFKAAPTGVYLAKLLKDISAAVLNGRSFTELEIGFYSEQIHKWHESTEELLRINYKKAKSAELAQWFLFIAILIIALDMVISLTK